jgi:hypothetical protein
MLVNEILQLIAIIVHSIIIIARVWHSENKTFKDLLATLVQTCLIVLFIHELGKEDLIYKAWYWFCFDYLLAFYFFTRIKTLNFVNKLNEKKMPNF